MAPLPPGVDPAALNSDPPRPRFAAPAFSGRRPNGEPWTSAELVSDRPTLLLFLGPDCDGCLPFFAAAADPVSAGLTDGEAVVLFLRDGAGDVLERCAEGVDVVLGVEPFDALRVVGKPFFVVLEQGVVLTEGVCFGLDQVRSHLRHARDGAGVTVIRLDEP